jgi:DNA-binding NtrC family response regulator
MNKKTVLVVDDEPMVLETFEAFLRLSGYNPLVAESAFDGREVLAQSSVDLVICDWKMPKEDGLSFIDYLNENYSHIPVIMVTGNPEAQLTLSAYERGVVEFLVKPVGRKELLETVKELFERVSSVKGCESDTIDQLLEGLK